MYVSFKTIFRHLKKRVLTYKVFSTKSFVL